MQFDWRWHVWGVAAVAAASMSTAYAQALPAFPGADGAARDVTGGRGGIVYHVTKLDQNYSDAGPGTLRYGLTDSNFGGAARTIVFDVAGTFWLGRFGADRGHDNGWDTQSRLNLGSNVTIAGQSAPGPVYIMGGVVKASGTNSILRNVTIAPGYGMRNFSKPDEGIAPTPGDFPDSYVYDAIDITGTNQMIDHVTTLYATDETISANELANNITIQYSSISQGQNYPQADAESSGIRYTGHALGSLLQGGSGAKISVLHNLYAHQKGRLPRVGSEVGSGAFNDFRNNVFYNWFDTAGGGASGQPSFNNFIGNFYLAGPGGDDVRQTAGPDGVSGTADDIASVVFKSGGTGIFNGASSSATRVYRSGNLRDTNKDGDANDTSSADSSFSSISSQSSAYDVNIGVTLSATQAYNNVLDYVGSNWWNRDAIDTRLVNEVRTGTGKIMAWADDPFNNDPNEGTEWRAMLAKRADPTTGAAPYTRGTDWDQEAGGGDGMPTWWEIEHGLDPFANDNNGDFDNDGYTNLEEYLNEVAAWPAPGVIQFGAAVSQRWAQIQNWKVSGISAPIAGQGTVATRSLWQPSRYDDVQLSGIAVVDAVGQHAGSVTVPSGAGLLVTDGWLRIADVLSLGGGGGARIEGGALHAPMIEIAPTGTLEVVGGVLHADAINASLAIDGGVLSPGVLTGELVIDGGIDLVSGALAIGISPTEGATMVLASGAAQLGGDLLVSLEGFEPSPTDDYLILAATSISGGFENLIGGRVPVDGGSFLVTADATTIVLSDFLASLPGDFNLDGVVDAADYTVWRDGLGTTHTAAEYSVWASAYGAGGPAGSNSAVPEPAGLFLSVVFAVIVCAAATPRRSS